MLFNTIEFAVFLAIVFSLYWAFFSRSVRSRNFFILAVSYIFYGWWGWKFLILIAFTTLSSYLSGILIEKKLNLGKRNNARWISGLNIAVNLTILFIFKYYNFFMTEFADRFLDGDTSGMLVRLVLPVGISFYTFQAIAYTVDVYRRTVPACHDATSFFAFIAFFPQLVAGPIERASNLLPQFYSLHRFKYAQAVEGMRLILWGLFKKVVVADNCGIVVDKIYSNYETYPGSTLLIGAVLFTFQIYCDFSGYSDMAVGIARLFGFNLMQNFRFPFLSRNMGEFWRRWHISLNTWFRDYIYIPLGGNRVGKIHWAGNVFIVFLLSGLWHGANWTYVMWGAYSAAAIIPASLLSKGKRNQDVIASYRKIPSAKELNALLLTMFLVIIGFIFFRSATLSDAWHYLSRIFSPTLFSLPTFEFSRRPLLICTIGIILLIAAEWLNRKKDFGLDLSGVNQAWIRWTIYYAIICSLILGKGVETFIYFQF